MRAKFEFGGFISQLMLATVSCNDDGQVAAGKSEGDGEAKGRTFGLLGGLLGAGIGTGLGYGGYPGGYGHHHHYGYVNLKIK